jgi:PIN domain nuclease of toxin-antitoxin system
MPIIKKLKQHILLLDTHILIWLVAGDSSLSHSFLKTIEESSRTDSILISPISLWEIGMLVEKKRIALTMDCQQWIDEVLNSPGIRLAPISAKIAILSTRLPGTVHGDPADRILIATAHEENAVLVTADDKLLEYGEDRWISVHNPLSK